MTEQKLQKTNVIDISNVQISYGRKSSVVQDVSFSVPDGQIFGLIGLNGAGKTTLIKSMLGLRTYNKGEIKIDGFAPHMTKSREGTAFLPERFDPPPFLTGHGFLDYSLNLHGATYDKKQAMQLALDLDLDREALKSRISTYSKGMRQKLGLMSVLMTPCNLFILDEPMSGLDPMARVLSKKALMEARERGAAIFLSSHILADMEELCDEIAVLHKGQIIYKGKPAALLKQQESETLERAFLKLIEISEKNDKKVA